MEYSYKFRIYPNKAQEELIQRTFGCVRFVYNHYLAQRIEQYKTNWYGKTVSVVDRFYPSSQTCACCGTQWDGTKDLKVRRWVCPSCGSELDRDINAAINIRNEGLRLLA